MSVIITTNEPPKVRELFADRVEIPMDFDMMLYTNQGKIGIERKDIPSDLLASVGDGRLQREIVAMRNMTDYQFVILHGRFIYRQDGTLSSAGFGRNWTKRAIRNLLRSLELVEGVYVEQAETNEDLVNLVNELQDYFDKAKHLSTKKARPKIQTDWLSPTRIEMVRHFYQGLPRISAVRAKQLEEKFPNPTDLFQASTDDILELSGFGKNLANGIYDFLRGGKDDNH